MTGHPFILPWIGRVNQQTRLQTRRALLDAAAQSFAERGYHQTPIDSISERAGVAKGTIYNYFSSKEEVLHALVREACQLAGDAATATPDGAGTEARLRAFVEGNLLWARDRGPLAVLFARELLAGDEQIKELIAVAAQPCIAKVAAILSDAIDAGEIAASLPPQSLALTFITLTNMLLLQSTERLTRWPAETPLPEMASRLFLHGVSGT